MRYKVYSVEDAVNQKLPEWEEWSDDDGKAHYYYENTNLLYKLDKDGLIIKFVNCDGGEPEDNTFRRDWSWVVDELNNAFNDGYDVGYRDASIDKGQA